MDVPISKSKGIEKIEENNAGIKKEKQISGRGSAAENACSSGRSADLEKKQMMSIEGVTTFCDTRNIDLGGNRNAQGEQRTVFMKTDNPSQFGCRLEPHFTTGVTTFCDTRNIDLGGNRNAQGEQLAFFMKIDNPSQSGCQLEPHFTSDARFERRSKEEWGIGGNYSRARYQMSVETIKPLQDQPKVWVPPPPPPDPPNPQ